MSAMSTLRRAIYRPNRKRKIVLTPFDRKHRDKRNKIAKGSRKRNRN